MRKKNSRWGYEKCLSQGVLVFFYNTDGCGANREMGLGNPSSVPVLVLKFPVVMGELSHLCPHLLNGKKAITFFLLPFVPCLFKLQAL